MGLRGGFSCGCYVLRAIGAERLVLHYRLRVGSIVGLRGMAAMQLTRIPCELALCAGLQKDARRA